MGDFPNLAKVSGYRARVNQAIDHVTRHLAEPLRLDDVAKAASFSPFHFHRIFKAELGETLNDFVKRVRLERAVQVMARRPEASLTDIALACGFSSSSDFSRTFKARYGVAPRAFDVDEHRETMKQAAGFPAPATGASFEVTLVTLPPRRVAYLRVLDPYRGGVPKACAALVSWATARGLERNQWLGYQWEDPEVVPLDQCRYDVAVVVPDEVVASDEVTIGALPELRVAEIAVEGDISLELAAFEFLYRQWLPESGYVPDHQPCFEAWNGLPYQQGMERFSLRVQLPVVPADQPL